MEERWKEHLSAAKVSRGSPAFGAAIRKHGVDAFDHKVLEVVSTKAEANDAESRWIKQLNCRVPHGYNITGGGDGPDFIHEDTKRKIAEASRARLQKMTPEQRAAYFLTNIHVWTPERKERARALIQSKEMRDKIASGQTAFWSKLTPEEKSKRVRHQLAGVTAEQKSEQVRKVWMNTSPEARAERIRKAQEAGAKAGPLRSKKMSDWQTSRQATLTPEQKRQVISKAWATRRAKYGKRGHAKPSEVFSEATRKEWANMTPEARAERVRKAQEGRQLAREARNARLVRINFFKAA
jgi:hypothetical protein